MPGSTEYRTPPAIFEALAREFRFNVDAAASDENALVGQWCDHGRLCESDHHASYGHGRYYTAETDGTKRDHYRAEDVVYANPPYSPSALVDAYVDTAAWTAKNLGATWVLLLNSGMTDTRRWHNHIWDRQLHRFRDRVEVRYPADRVAFLRPDGKPSTPRYSNMLVIFRPPLEVLK